MQILQIPGSQGRRRVNLGSRYIKQRVLYDMISSFRIHNIYIYVILKIPTLPHSRRKEELWPWKIRTALLELGLVGVILPSALGQVGGWEGHTSATTMVGSRVVLTAQTSCLETAQGL